VKTEVQTAGGLQLQTLIDDVVEDVDEGVVGEAVAHLLELELEGGEAFGDVRALRVRFLLILLEW
jgi:hypothetical protein